MALSERRYNDVTHAATFENYLANTSAPVINYIVVGQPVALANPFVTEIAEALALSRASDGAPPGELEFANWKSVELRMEPR
jgi:hypothetical protein